MFRITYSGKKEDMLRSFNGGAVHVKISSFEQGIEACHLGGFNSLAMHPGLVEGRDLDETRAVLKNAAIEPGAWGIPFDWRGSEADYESGFEKMKEQTALMAGVGVSRCATWILPGSNDRNWDANWAFHVRRLKPIAKLLEDHGMVLGLEFIGPKTLRDIFRHPFVYTILEMIDLGRDMNSNVGVLLDAWHLHTSEGSLEQLSMLDPRQIALVHINDAPSGIPVTELVDNKRHLPCATGVIDLKGFFDMLRKIGYDGPVEAEPFDESLKELANDEDRIRRVGESVAKAFSL
jgi:sugar phosphate isomerase/epimerase